MQDQLWSLNIKMGQQWLSSWEFLRIFDHTNTKGLTQIFRNSANLLNSWVFQLALAIHLKTKIYVGFFFLSNKIEVLSNYSVTVFFLLLDSPNDSNSFFTLPILANFGSLKLNSPGCTHCLPKIAKMFLYWKYFFGSKL